MIAIIKRIGLAKLESTVWNALVQFTLYDNGEKHGDSEVSVMLDYTLGCSLIGLEKKIAAEIEKTYPGVEIVETTTYRLR